MRTLASLWLLLGFAPPALSNPAAVLISRGDVLDAQLKTSEALELYLEAEKADPRNAELLIKIAKQYGESMVDVPTEDGQRAAAEKALQYSRRAAEIEPDRSDAHLAVAICYGRLLGRVSTREKVEYSRELKAAVDQAIQLDPRSDYAWHILGRWQRSVAEIDGLKRGLAKIIYGDVPKVEAKEAITSFEKARALNPGRLSHHIELGITYAETGETAKARASIERGLSMPNRERDDENTKSRGRKVLEALEESQ